MLTFACPQCARPLKAGADLFGKKVKCPGCGHILTAPHPAAAPLNMPQGQLPPPSAEIADMPTLVPPDMQGSPAPDRSLLPRQPPPAEQRTPASSDSPSGDDTQAEPANADRDLTSFLAPPQQPDELGRLGPYRILKVLGQGGMGVVYQAEDPGLKRLVALKAMLPALAVHPAARQRFSREARTAAAIKHDYIVTIHQVSEDRGVPYLAMEFLRGEPLDVRLTRQPPLTVAEVVRIGRQAAEGLAAAHEEGLIHRDIKPANIWLETRGQRSEIRSQKSEVPLTSDLRLQTSGFRVKILDFGLARATAEDAHITQSGVVIGTPAYMAPEQAGGEEVDHRCDLFSLGSVLYRALTGQPAFKGKDTYSIVMALATSNPPPPAQLDARVPQPLSDLVMRLLAKKPGDRPGSAAQVAEALAALESPSGVRTSGGYPSYAPPRPSFLSAALSSSLSTALSTARSSWSKLRASPLLATPGRRWAAGAGGGLLAFALVLWLFGAFSSRTAPLIVPVNPKAATPSHLLVDHDDIDLQIAVRQKGATLISKTAERKIELAPGEYELEIVEGPPRIILSPQTIVVPKDGQVTVRAVHADVVESVADFRAGDPMHPQAWVAAPAEVKGVRTWTLQTRGHQGNVLALAVAPASRMLASGGSDGTIRLWDVATGKLVNILHGHSQSMSGAATSSGVVHLAWTRDGKTLASAGVTDKTFRLWDAETGRLLRSWLAPAGVAVGATTLSERLAFSPSGKVLAFGQTKGKVALWRSASGAPLDELVAPDDTQIQALAWSPTGDVMAGAGDNGVIYLWEAAANRLQTTWPGQAKGKAAAALAWSPDGQYLAHLYANGDATIWNAVQRNALRTWRPLDIGTGHSLAWFPDGRTLVVSGSAGAAVWKVDGDKPAHTFPVKSVLSATLAEENLLAFNAVAVIGTVELVNHITGKIVSPPAPGYRQDLVNRTVWSANGKTLGLTGTNSAKLWLWDVEGGQFIGTSSAKLAAATSIDLDQDGKTLALGGATGIELWDVASDRQHAPMKETEDKAARVLFAPDGKQLASAHADNKVRMWDLAGQKLLRTLSDQAVLLAWSPDGRMLACRDSADKLVLFDAATGKPLGTPLPFKAGSLWAWSAPHQLLAHDFYKIWDWEKNTSVGFLSGKGTAAGFLPGGKTLAVYDSATADLYHVDSASGKTLRVMERVAPPPAVGRFAPDGHLAALNFTQNGLRFFDAATGKVRGTYLFLTDASTAPKGKKADDPHYLIVSPGGHFRSSSAKFEQELVYLVQTSRGHETLNLADFTRKYGWKNDPSRAWK